MGKHPKEMLSLEFAFLAMRYWREFVREDLDPDLHDRVLAPVFETAFGLPSEAVENYSNYFGVY